MLNNYTFKDIATNEEKDLFAQKGLRNIRMKLCVQDAIEMLNTETYISKNGSKRHMITKNGNSVIITGAMLVIAYHGNELKSPFYSSVLDKMVDKDVALFYVWNQTKNFQRLTKHALTKYGYDEIPDRQLADDDIHSISWLCFIEAIMNDFNITRYADKAGRFDSAHFMRLAKAWHQYANINLCGSVKAAIVETAGIKSTSYFNTMMFAKINGINLYDYDAENTMRQMNQVKLQKLNDINAIRKDIGKSKKYCYTEREKELFIEGHQNVNFGIKPVSLKTVVNAREYCQTIKAINTATNEIPDVAESYEVSYESLYDAINQLDDKQKEYIQIKFFNDPRTTQADLAEHFKMKVSSFVKFEKQTLGTLKSLMSQDVIENADNNDTNDYSVEDDAVILTEIV